MRTIIRRDLLATLWVTLIVLAAPVAGAQETAPAETPSILLNCRLGGKLYVNRQFIGVVVGGHQYPIFDVAPGDHAIRIVGTDETWDATVTVTDGKPVVLLTPMAKPKPKPKPPVVVTPKPKPKPPVVVTPKPKPKPRPPVPTRKEWVVGGLGLQLVPIPAGRFAMGDKLGRAYEQPVHTVTLSSPFWMGRTHVTSAQYMALVPDFRMRGKPDDTPMVNMTWWDAVVFGEALTKREQSRLPKGYEFRLPTEAEWEYCCRAGTQTRFFFGDDDNAIAAYAVAARSPQKVGTLKPNPWGLYDMYGNVQEFCLDASDRLRAAPKTYVEGAVDPLELKGEYRILRSGHYRSRTSSQYSAYRTVYSPMRAYKANGFRVVLAPKMPIPSEGSKPRGR